MKIKILLLIITSYAGTVLIHAQTTVQLGATAQGYAGPKFFPLGRIDVETNVRSLALYTAEELSGAGIDSGAIILSVAFNKVGLATMSIPLDYKLYMGNSNRTVFGNPTISPVSWSSVLSNDSLVYSNPVFNIPPIQGWVIWNITPFFYTGGSLEIAADVIFPVGTIPSTLISWSRMVAQGGTPPLGDKVVAGRSFDGVPPALLNSAQASLMGRSTISITYIVPGPCNAPSIASINNITSNSADINWTSFTPPAAGYECAVTTSNTPPASGTVTDTTLYHATGLAGATQYYVHVRNNCGYGIFSPWVSASFTTACPRPSPFIVSTDPQTGHVTISWNKVKEATEYEYAVRVLPAPPTNSSAALTGDTILYPDHLQPGLKYYFHIRSHCSKTNFSDWATIEFHPAGVEVFPNPVRDKLTIRVHGQPRNGWIDIYDLWGRVCKKIKLTGNTVDVNMSGMAAGIYLVKYENYKGYVTRIMKW